PPAFVSRAAVIPRETAALARRRLEVDQLGLDAIARRMLSAIIQNYGGGPVGLETLAATIGEEAVTLEDVYEPYLMQIGFLTRTPPAGAATDGPKPHLLLEPRKREPDQLRFAARGRSFPRICKEGGRYSRNTQKK